MGFAKWTVCFSAFAQMIWGSGFIPRFPVIGDALASIMSYLPEGLSSQYFVDIITPLTCHLWFLPALFFGIMFYLVLQKKCLDKWWKTSLTVVVLLLLASLETVIPYIKQLPFTIGRGFFAASCIIKWSSTLDKI